MALWLHRQLPDGQSVDSYRQRLLEGIGNPLWVGLYLQGDSCPLVRR
jgi:hypothetical protein